MEQLRVTLPRLPQLMDIELDSIGVPKDWLRSFKSLNTLDVTGENPEASDSPPKRSRISPRCPIYVCCGYLNIR